MTREKSPLDQPLTFCAIDIWGQIVPGRPGCPVRGRLFGSIPAFTQEMSVASHPHMTTKTISRHCRLPQG